MKIKDAFNTMRTKDYELDLETDSLEKLIFLAYECGKSDGAQHAASLYSAELRNQKERALKCRYYKLAMKIQGDIEWVYDTNYSNYLYETFCYDETKLIKKEMN